MKLADVKNIVVSPLFGEPGHTHISTDGDASINDAPSGDEIAPRDLLPGTDEDEWINAASILVTYDGAQPSAAQCEALKVEIWRWLEVCPDAMVVGPEVMPMAVQSDFVVRTWWDQARELTPSSGPG